MFNNLLKGAAWSVGLAWLSRFIGLFSVIIVARILTPEDYGIVAIAMIVMHFIQNLSSAGTSQYLIQKTNLDADDIRTSWTLLILFRAFYCAALFLASGQLSIYFNEPRLEPVFQVLSIVPMFDAVKNIGLFLEEKKINYRPVFMLGLSRKVIGFAVSVTLALNGFNYWSLIYGEVIGCVVFALCSYIYLPVERNYLKPTLVNVKFQFSFYSWSFLQVFIGFTKSKIDGLLMAKYVGSSGMGEYHLSSSLADMPSNELATPITRPLYAGLAQHESDSPQQIQLAYKSLAAMSLIVFFLSLLLASTSEEIVSILLGEKWSAIPAVVSILSTAYALYASGTILQRLLTVQAKVKLVFYLDCISFIVIFAIIGYAAIEFKTLLAISYGRLLSSSIVLFITIGFTAQYTKMRFLLALQATLPSLVVGVLSYFVTCYVFTFIDAFVFIILITKFVLYTIIFMLGMYAWSYFRRFQNYELFFVSNMWLFALKKVNKGR
ncbi:oligosaccharide flippase family protein [Rheinheimera sp. UJ63]|uniref:oligosaccharide flippase family protein n=1 Tax=Rheinheimera sp. UJ63 TaxID=2910157 RepID=UPI001F22CDA9|nr:oligosaccharide flippase family protein [Rheinheimera sp. UJ63]MCF4007805.1 oligosaccharide flippase family protein [Rheinheimera sp. UJ63]